MSARGVDAMRTLTEQLRVLAQELDQQVARYREETGNDPHVPDDQQGPGPMVEAMYLAAEEIERLRAAIDYALGHLKDDHPSGESKYEAIRALEAVSGGR
jgi:hypothetical protein